MLFRTLLVLLGVAGSLAAQDDPAAIRKQIDDLHKVGQIASTEPLLEQLMAIEQEASGENSDRLIPLLEQLARVAIAQSRFDRAEQFYSRAQTIIETGQGKAAPALIPILIATARMHQMAGDFAKAEVVLLRGIAVRIQATGPQTSDIAGDYLLLARLYASQKKYTQAVGVFGWTLDILEKLYGVDDPRLLPALDGIAGGARENDEFDRALLALSRALAIRQLNIGPAHPDLAQTLDSLGNLLFAMKRFEESEAMYSRSLPIWIKNLGPTHPMIATSLDNLGVALAAQRKFEKAEEVYRQSLALRDEQSAASLRNLGLVLSARDKWADAEKYLKRGIQLAADPSPVLASLLQEYADVLDHLRRKPEAVGLRARARKMEAVLSEREKKLRPAASPERVK